MMEEKQGFDRNQIIGFILIGVIFMAYTWWAGENLPDEPVVAEQVVAVEEPVAISDAALPVTDQGISAEASESTSDVTSLQGQDFVSNEGVAQADIVIEEYTLENDVVRYVFTNDGAQMVEVQVKDQKDYLGNPLMLVNRQQRLGGANEGLFVADHQGNHLNLTQGETTWTFELGDSYGLAWSLVSPSEGSLDLTWFQDGIRHEKAFSQEVTTTTTYYWDASEGDESSLSDGRDDQESASNVSWVAHKQQFFSSIFTCDQHFTQVDLRTKTPIQNDSTRTRAFRSKVSLAAVNGEIRASGLWVHIPNQYDMLREVDETFGNIIPFGWGIFGWISKGVVVPFFRYLEGLGLGYGLIIFVMALFFKGILSPLTFASYKSMAKMRVLKPEMDAIAEKYPDKGDSKKQQETMALYQKTGVNPLGGCLPQLLGLPILIALFRFFPASFELRQQAFLWADDLSSYDSIMELPMTIPFYGDHVSLFTILMAISTFMYTKMNNQMSAGSTAGNSMMQQQMKVIQYLMPVMLLVWFNSYSSGLSYYYFLSNILVFGQQWAIRKFFINEDAIRAKIEVTKAKGGRKSKFASKMESMLEQQTEGNRRTRRMK